MYSLVGKNTLFYIYMSRETTYYKLVALPIQYKLIKKVD